MSLVSSLAPGGDDLTPLWRSPDGPMNPALLPSLRHIREKLLRTYEDEPMVLVLPESAFTAREAVMDLFSALLESGVTPAVYGIRPSVAWAVSHGRSSALVTDIGFHQTSSVAVLDGQALTQSSAFLPVGASTVLDAFSGVLVPMLSSSLASRFAHLTSPHAQRHVYDVVARCVMERWGFITSHTHPITDVPNPRGGNCFVMPDGSPLALTPEQRCIPFETLFSSSPGAAEGSTSANIADSVVKVKQTLDPEWVVEGVHHLFVGGCSATPGMLPRLSEELRDRDSTYTRFDRDGLLQLGTRSDGAWAGASLLASTASFRPLFITKEEFSEEGFSVLFRKLFY